MCSRDLLFFVNTFGWTYAPKDHPAFPERPFVTYDYQDEFLMALLECMGKQDILAKKSRGVGVTWLVLVAMGWLAMFRDYQSFMLSSWKEELVDKAGNYDSLFGKLDFFFEHLPRWLAPTLERTHLHAKIVETNSMIDGTSTTENAGRAGRRTAFFPDEFAFVPDGFAMESAIRANTNCRIFCSTPNGPQTAFHALEDKPSIRQIRLHWSLHPEWKRGLYRSAEGLLDILDKGFDFGRHYGFILDGRLRSPWYDEQWNRAANTVEIARELDMDDMSSIYQAFDPAKTEQYRKEFCALPLRTGSFEFDADGLTPKGFVPGGGIWKVWCHVDDMGRVSSDHEYVIGCDVGLGTGASCSTLVVYDAQTREKVAEASSNRHDVRAWAEEAVAACRRFAGPQQVPATLIWEGNGPGASFGDSVVKRGHGRIWFRRDEKSLAKKVSGTPGFWSSGETKRVLLQEYRSALCEKKIVNRSDVAIMQALEYIVDMNQDWVHVQAKNANDPTARGENHGDLVIADALACKVLLLNEIAKPKEKAEKGSLKWLMEREEMERAKKEDEELW